MNFIGIDIGSTAAKVVVIGDKKVDFVMPTGWNSKETAEIIKNKLKIYGVYVEKQDSRVIATGYGRVSVRYADKVITEITCHGRGGRYMAGEDCTIIDVGGQDTKVISVKDGMVSDFLMNDKCSAGTGKFVEVMADRLGVSIDELFDLARKGKAISISSMCTVFAESEIIGYIGEGRAREDIAAGIIDSVASKVAVLCNKYDMGNKVILTGGFSGNDFFTNILGHKLHEKIYSQSYGRFAGALGAALIAQSKYMDKK